MPLNSNLAELNIDIIWEGNIHESNSTITLSKSLENYKEIAILTNFYGFYLQRFDAKVGNSLGLRCFNLTDVPTYTGTFLSLAERNIEIVDNFTLKLSSFSRVLFHDIQQLNMSFSTDSQHFPIYQVRGYK